MTTTLPPPPTDETEYEYSGSEEEDDGHGEEGEPRYGGRSLLEEGGLARCGLVGGANWLYVGLGLG